MSRPVFISYARSSNAGHAQALAECLGELAFFDTDAIEDGDRFPEHLLEGVLGARVVVIFASEVYCQRSILPTRNVSRPVLWPVGAIAFGCGSGQRFGRGVGCHARASGRNVMAGGR